MAKRALLTAEHAESLAISALGWLASDPERIGRFLAVTGLGPDNLRKAAADPRFLGSVLDYVLANEADLLAFAADAQANPEDVSRAAQVLGGIRQENWS
jgi:hypothetical protein